MRLLRLALSLTLVLLAVLGCAPVSDGESPEQAAVEDAVWAYSAALSEAFAHMDMNRLSQVATEEQAWTEYALMAALGEGRVRMLADVVDIEFGEVDLPDEGTAVVTTTETWDYRHESLDTSETVREERGVVYHLRYELVLKDGRWLVDRVTSLDADASPSEDTTS